MKKKILIIARNCPLPTNDGEKLRVFNIIKYLSRRYSIALVYRILTEQEKKYKNDLLKYCDYVEDILIPSPRNHYQRLLRIWETYKSGYPLICSPNYFPSIADALKKVTQKMDFDAVQIEHSLLYSYLDSLHLKNSCLKIVTVHNIDFVRYQRLFKKREFSLKQFFYSIFTSKLKQIEINSLNNFNYSLTMSEIDSNILKKNGYKGKIIIVPNGVDTSTIHPLAIPKNNNILFVGSLDYDANKDGVLWFLNEVWPKVTTHDIDNVKLMIIGRNPDNIIRSYESKDIIITGTVDELAPYYKTAKVCIVPLKAGGGTRLKIFEGLAYGIPIVTTTIGCEGINVENNKNILIADSPDEFSVAIKKLYTDNKLWKNISNNGRTLVEQKYSWENIIKQYNKIL